MCNAVFPAYNQHLHIACTYNYDLWKNVKEVLAYCREATLCTEINFYHGRTFMQVIHERIWHLHLFTLLGIIRPVGGNTVHHNSYSQD